MRKKEEGFTLIELMVTIGIMVIINGVIFFNYPKVMANLALRRTADEIALTARQAQAYAMAAKSVVVGTETELPSYGVHFNINTPTSIILFKDLDPDGTGPGVPNFQYDGSGEHVQTFEIQTKDKIAALACVKGGITVCSGTADVVYSRQSPTATITGDADYLRIRIDANRDSSIRKRIYIYKNGYISVQ